MLSRERIGMLRGMADLQTERHAKLGGAESSYQVAVNPSELRALIDQADDARLGKAVREVIGTLTAAKCDRIADSAFGGALFSDDLRGFGQLMRTIASALREESERCKKAEVSND